jgi:hypothetical protein
MELKQNSFASRDSHLPGLWSARNTSRWWILHRSFSTTFLGWGWWQLIVSASTSSTVTSKFQGTRSLDMTFGADADDALWRHLSWRRITPWQRIVTTPFLTTHVPLAMY